MSCFTADFKDKTQYTVLKMALHTGFEPASRYRPNAFKAPSSPPGHAAYLVSL